MKNNRKLILGIIIGIIMMSGVGVVAAIFNAEDISFTPNDSSWEVTNVKEAMDSLYTKTSNASGKVAMEIVSEQHSSLPQTYGRYASGNALVYMWSWGSSWGYDWTVEFNALENCNMHWQTRATSGFTVTLTDNTTGESTSIGYNETKTVQLIKGHNYTYKLPSTTLSNASFSSVFVIDEFL